jgi:protein tyrosine/serine phosphatase
MHMSVRVVDLSHFPITCGSPAAIEPVDYKDWDIEFIVSLDEDTFAVTAFPPMYGETLGLTRIVRHIPNPYRGKGKPIDMSVVDMGEVRKTALMIVLLSEIGGVFFHCRKGKDRTGIVKAEVEHLLSQLMEASACE